jgi:hypothetical protein
MVRSLSVRRLVAASLLVVLAGCGHSQPDKDYGGTSGGGSPPPSSGKGGHGAGGDGGVDEPYGPFAVSPNCKAIEQQFNDYLPRLLACPPKDTAVTCNTKYRSHIVCGCDIFVQSADFEAIAALQGAINNWDAQACANEVVCPEIECPSFTNGICTPSGDGGVCESR